MFRQSFLRPNGKSFFKHLKYFVLFLGSDWCSITLNYLLFKLQNSAIKNSKSNSFKRDSLAAFVPGIDLPN
jgi:hypothetical protein